MFGLCFEKKNPQLTNPATELTSYNEKSGTKTFV